MSASAIRHIACAGALATGLLLSGAGAGMSMADPGDPTSAGSEGAAATGNADANTAGGSGGSEAKPDKEPPAATFGSGRDNDTNPSVKEEKKPEPGVGTVGTWPKFKHSLSIPILRLPTPEEVNGTGWPDPSVFWGTLEVPVPSIDGFLTSLSQPQPEPTPGPAFRGQEEAPVIDVTGGGGGSGSMAAAENNGAPPAFELPLVMAPAIPIPGAVALTVPVGASAPTGPPMAAGAPTAVAGARAPLIRGSLSPRAETANTSMTPMSGQATRVAYPRFVRTPTVAQLAAVAMPGVAGLMFLTFSGSVIGYRQANSIRFIRTAGAERFL
jgi:hypothetical protein